MISELNFLSAHELANGILARKISAQEVVEAHLCQIATHPLGQVTISRFRGR